MDQVPAQHVPDSTPEIPFYGDDFFANIAGGARRSADEVVGLVGEIFAPASMVDIGGGAGHWAAAFRAIGITDILSIDGPWVPEAARAVPAEQFREHDLTQPLVLDRGFDVALSVEAAEHLPDACAADLVRTLTQAAPVVVFSAAVPGQGGDGHVNEQRAPYWAALFAQEDYACFTDLRSRIWHNPAVEVWYRQNLLCFVRRSQLHRWADRLDEERAPNNPLLDVAHPDLVLRHRGEIDRTQAYAGRLEQQVQRANKELDEALRELNATRQRLAAITSSRTWRACNKITTSVRRLTGRP